MEILGCFVFFWFVEILCFPEHDLGEGSSLHHFSSGPPIISRIIIQINSVENGRGKQGPIFSIQNFLRKGDVERTSDHSGSFEKTAIHQLILGKTLRAFSTFELYDSCYLNI